MTVKLGVVMDPIKSINVKKDSTLAMLLEAQGRGWSLYYMEQRDLGLRDGRAMAHMRDLKVFNDSAHWFELGAEAQLPLDALDVVLMRKDPPFDMEYIGCTYILERAEEAGVLVLNRPQGLRDINEKFYTAWFAQCCAPTLVSRRSDDIKAFFVEHGDIILKPLDRMGGASVFRLRKGDPNVNVVIETLTDYENRHTMAQRFVPEIAAGDKRIILVDGEPVPYALARVPAPGETRGNLAVGAKGVGIELSERDRWICSEVGPVLRDKGMIFVGIDVIGDYLTEINVTSPTGIRELDAYFGLNISALFMDSIEKRLK